MEEGESGNKERSPPEGCVADCLEEVDCESAGESERYAKEEGPGCYAGEGFGLGREVLFVVKFKSCGK